MDSDARFAIGLWSLIVVVVVVGATLIGLPKEGTVRVTNLTPDEIDVTILRDGLIVWVGEVDGSTTLELNFETGWFKRGQVTYTVQFPNTLYEREVYVGDTAFFIYEG